MDALLVEFSRLPPARDVDLSSEHASRCKRAFLQLFCRSDEVAIVSEAHDVPNRVALEHREQVIVVAFPVHHVDRVAWPTQAGFGGQHAAGPAKRLALRILAELPLVPASRGLASHPALRRKHT